MTNQVELNLSHPLALCAKFDEDAYLAAYADDDGAHPDDFKGYKKFEYCTVEELEHHMFIQAKELHQEFRKLYQLFLYRNACLLMNPDDKAPIGQTLAGFWELPENIIAELKEPTNQVAKQIQDAFETLGFTFNKVH